MNRLIIISSCIVLLAAAVATGVPPVTPQVAGAPARASVPDWTDVSFKGHHIELVGDMKVTQTIKVEDGTLLLSRSSAVPITGPQLGNSSGGVRGFQQ